MEINGRDIAQGIYDDLKIRVQKLLGQDITPTLVVFLVGEDPGSKAYVLQKQIRGQDIKAQVDVLSFPQNTTTDKLLTELGTLYNKTSVHGVIVQRPLPEQVNASAINDAINPEKDVDGFLPDSPFNPPIVLATVRFLEEAYKKKGEGQPDLISWLKTKKIIVIGKGETAGKPVLDYLNEQGLSPVVIDSRTENPDDVKRSADIIISGVGRPGILTSKNIKKGAILVGIGIHREDDGKLHGDYNDDDVKGVAAFYTPTPRGVGPVNVAMLLSNLVLAAEQVSEHLHVLPA